MKVAMGAESKIDASNLKKGDILYAAAYNAATESVEFDRYEFDSYIKQVTQTEKMAKFYKIDDDGNHIKEHYKNKDGMLEEKESTLILDAAKGLFSSKEAALDALLNAIEKICKDIRKFKELGKA